MNSNHTITKGRVSASTFSYNLLLLFSVLGAGAALKMITGTVRAVVSGQAGPGELNIPVLLPARVRCHQLPQDRHTRRSL